MNLFTGLFGSSLGKKYIMAITGLATNEQVRGIARRGVATCLRKPFDVRELLTAIARVRAATPVRK